MSRSPCASLKNILPIKDFKSPNVRLKSPFKASPVEQCKTRNVVNRRSLSVDTPNRLLFVSSIKNTTHSSNVLGRGRFGQVVLAKYKGANVAVKMIKDVSEQQFLNETNAEELSHQNIIEIVKIEKIDSDVVILMQPWGSINLQQLLAVSTNIPWNDVISYVKQLASALNYCHSKGILHLDVKPANMMVNDQGWIKLGDFGNSLTIHQISSGAFQQRVGRVGTVSYCPPEILQGLVPSTKSDVYSFGVTTWQLQHNQTPFSDLSWPTVAYLVVAKNQRPTLRENMNSNETRLTELYCKCWSPGCDDRPCFEDIMKTLDGF